VCPRRPPSSYSTPRRRSPTSAMRQALTSVSDAIAGGASISAVNLAEALSTLATRGNDPEDLVSEPTGRGLLDGAVTVEPFTGADATEVARLRPPASSAGRSLAERACLAAARRLHAEVLTVAQACSGLKLDVRLSPAPWVLSVSVACTARRAGRSKLSGDPVRQQRIVCGRDAHPLERPASKVALGPLIGVARKRR
jgi:PIN domain nuclease of toxin-antitoxin system